MTPPDCPYCLSPGSMLEHLSRGRFFCNGCAGLLETRPDGQLVRVQRTAHTPRVTDVSGHVMTDP
tara:strand:- start:34 stop:228 length:195 start_codon:yes stop_codon:yes gene_type:complete